MRAFFAFCTCHQHSTLDCYPKRSLTCCAVLFMSTLPRRAVRAGHMTFITWFQLLCGLTLDNSPHCAPNYPKASQVHHASHRSLLMLRLQSQRYEAATHVAAAVQANRARKKIYRYTWQPRKVETALSCRSTHAASPKSCFDPPRENKSSGRPRRILVCPSECLGRPKADFTSCQDRSAVYMYIHIQCICSRISFGEQCYYKPCRLQNLAI